MARRFRNLVDRLLDRGLRHDVRPYEAVAAAACALEDRMRETSDLRAWAGAMRGRPALPDAFALVREAARRTVGERAFDVQLVGAAAMLDGRVAEMQTGEGKTLAAVFTAFVHALRHGSVHVLTANDYLARRDAAWMGPVYELLGVSVGCVQQTMTPDERRRAYAAEVTYATANEVGFDLLRDHLVERPEDVAQRELRAAIVDEADSILIDEARIPLVIAGGETASREVVHQAWAVVGALDETRDFALDEHGRSVYLTDAGLDRVEAAVGVDLHSSGGHELLTAVNQALHARVLLRRDVDYVIRDGAVHLVDELKGRVVHRRRWPDGVQSAVEAKEGLDVTPEARVLSSITLQALVKGYDVVCGMTGTAATSAEELAETYGLEVVVVPTNVPCVRVDHPDVVFTHLEEKESALVEEIAAAHAKGRPVLVGTASVAESERLADAVRARDVPCEVLNARNDELEAGVVALAGDVGAVTISTNMAGRGTDIRLGGPAEARRDEVVALGGLYVIGTNRHSSPRIDNQLRGRAGRQGDPGESRFFVSVEDPLVQQYGESVRAMSRREGRVEDGSVVPAIDSAQRLADALNFQARQNLWRYARIVEAQRRMVHARREDALHGRGVPPPPDELVGAVGEDAATEAARRVTLFELDRTWEEHLAALADVREGIHVVSLGRLDPVDEFQRAAADLFDRAYAGIEDAVTTILVRAPVVDGAVDLEAVGVTRPGATWSYLLGDDRPALTGDWYRMFKGIRHRLAGD